MQNAIHIQRARQEEGSYETQLFVYFLLCIKGLPNDDVGVARGTVFQQIRPGAGFKTGDFVKEEGVEGATVERLDGRQRRQKHTYVPFLLMLLLQVRIAAFLCRPHFLFVSWKNDGEKLFRIDETLHLRTQCARH